MQITRGLWFSHEPTQQEITDWLQDVAHSLAGLPPVQLTQPNLIDTSLGIWEVLVLWEGLFELRELTAKWLRTPAAGVAQDAAMCTFHFLNITGGAPDSTWTTADYQAIEARFDTMWTSLKVLYGADVKLTELSWRADGPAFKPFGDELQPTLRAVARSVVGTGTGDSLPPQIAVSVTETTDAKYTVLNVEGVGTQSRNRWGRFYLPAPIESVNEGGRIGAGFLANFADPVDTFYEGCVTDEFAPVVYSPTTGKAWSIKEIHVDDIWDVIRSRRYITPLARTPRTLTQLVT